MSDETSNDVNGNAADVSSRRTFLHLMLAGIGGISAAAAAYPIFKYLSPLGGGEKNATVEFNESDVAPGEVKLFTFQGNPAAIVNLGNAFMVTSIVCTHLGCLVKWKQDDKEFLCPCHAARFSPEGKVISGPPQSPLKTIPFKISAGKITIGGNQG